MFFSNKQRAREFIILFALFFYISCSSKEEKIIKARNSYKIKLLSYQNIEKGTALDFLVYNNWGDYFKGITVEIWVMKNNKCKEKREVFIPTENLRPFYEEQITVIIDGLHLEEDEGLALIEIPNPTPLQKKRFKEFQ
jgi:hypothetical protein